MDFIVHLGRGREENAAEEVWQFDLQSDPNLLEHPSMATCIAVLVGGSLICTLLAAWLCSRREFHVKTPESE
jgi:hypothetical protein